MFTRVRNVFRPVTHLPDTAARPDADEFSVRMSSFFFLFFFFHFRVAYYFLRHRSLLLGDHFIFYNPSGTMSMHRNLCYRSDLEVSSLLNARVINFIIL